MRKKFNENDNKYKNERAINLKESLELNQKFLVKVEEIF